MSYLGDWNGYEDELETFLKGMLTQGRKPPKEAVELLKTADLKKALALADSGVAKDDVDIMRKAVSKMQKFFMMYGNTFKQAKAAVKKDNTMQDLSDALNTHFAYMGKTQSTVAVKADSILKDAKAAATDDAKRLELEIKTALSPLRFYYDWGAAKKDFENETGVKKPSSKIMGEFRKSAGLDKTLEAMDKACKNVEPKKYREAFDKFVIAHTNYASVLEKALASDKAADAIYKRKCEGLKDVLNSIENRAQQKVQMLDKLGA